MKAGKGGSYDKCLLLLVSSGRCQYREAGYSPIVAGRETASVLAATCMHRAILSGLAPRSKVTAGNYAHYKPSRLGVESKDCT